MLNLFAPGEKLIIGMVHVGPSPGTPFYSQDSLAATTEKAIADAQALERGGANGCLLQNNDRTYSIDSSDPVVIAHMARIATLVRAAVSPGFQVGVQLMVNDIRSSLAITKVCGGTFTRAVAMIGRTTTRHGSVQAKPYEVLAYRQSIGAQHIPLVVQIDSVQFRWEGPPTTIGELAASAKQLGAAAVEIAHSDENRALEQISVIRRSVPDLPIMLGGYTNQKNAARLLQRADGAFVGSAFEVGGWGGNISQELVAEYVNSLRYVS